MNPYRTTVADTRAIDAMAAAMRKRQRHMGKKARAAAIERAKTKPSVTDKREGRA